VRASGVPEWPAPGAPIEELLRFQSVACGALGSSLYEDLLSHAAADFEAGGPTRAILAGHEDDPGGSALVLRMMGAVHRLVLEGSAPELAERYRAGDGDSELTWAAFRAVLEAGAEVLRSSIERPVQTNEVGRCAALLPGFLSVASATGMPLRLLEVGASAGLNLRWDAYRYEADGFAWGPPDSPLRIAFELSGGPVPAAPEVAVAERLGCDAAPLDPRTDEGRVTMLAYIWPDQTARLERMRAAIELSGGLPAEIERRSAPEWVAERLAGESPGRATVVYHSIVMQYLTPAEREAFEENVMAAGERASAEAPLAWLSMEPAGGMTDVRLRTWPDGESRLLARAGYHGTPVDLTPPAG
jgi:hypothetical protein